MRERGAEVEREERALAGLKQRYEECEAAKRGIEKWLDSVVTGKQDWKDNFEYPGWRRSWRRLAVPQSYVDRRAWTKARAPWRARSASGEVEQCCAASSSSLKDLEAELSRGRVQPCCAGHLDCWRCVE